LLVDQSVLVRCFPVFPFPRHHQAQLTLMHSRNPTMAAPS
jgi:hypothetical protein